MAESEELIIYKCKYWNEFEPPKCLHWDSVGHICTFEVEEGESLPDFFPYCNYIGTAHNCSEYNNTGDVIPMCVLPDPSRHVCNRATGDKWVPYPTLGVEEEEATAEEGVETESEYASLDFSAITGYNDGLCDGEGKDITCKGYNQSHMSFGMLDPADEDDAEVDTLFNGKYSTIKELGTRTPIDYVIRNLMANLGKCYWWKGFPTTFLIKEEESTDVVTGETTTKFSVTLEGEWLCTYGDKDQYKTFSDEYGPPCNGCKESCSNYTGICWKYCIDDKMRSGDPILCEHIHELRYYVRQNAWTADTIKKYFYDEGFIYSWKGDLSDRGPMGNIKYQFNALTGGIEAYEIGSIKTYMDSFLFLKIEADDIVITEGTAVDGKAEPYPTLIRAISQLSLPPIIMNEFIEVDDNKYFEVIGLCQSDLLIFGKVFYPATSCQVYALNLSNSNIRAVIPKEILAYDSMIDIELSLGKEKFSEFYNSFEKIINAIIKTGSENVFFNTLNLDSTFFCNIKMVLPEDSYYGTDQQDIAVFQNTPNGIEYSKVTFNKVFVGGTLVQTEFSLAGYGKTQTPYDYTKGFNANINYNGKIKFKFSPISGSYYTPRCSYMYNDMEMAEMCITYPEPPALPTLYRGFKLYKVYISNYILSNGQDDGEDDGEEVTDCEFVQLSPDGYVLINLNSRSINNVFGAWEFSSITVGSCEMEVVCHGADGLIGPNQLIVKPKDMKTFKSVCNDTPIVIKDLCYYDKQSYGGFPLIDEAELWSYELVDSEVYEVSYVKERSIMTTDMDDAGTITAFTLEAFQFTMVPSVVIVGIEGRPLTQYRTKPIGWVKQPFCPDVEIYYAWSAAYSSYANVPACYCCESFKGKQYEGPGGESLVPPCGDHDVSSITNSGPMWWPYDNCSDYKCYDIINNLGYGSYDIIGLFKEDGGGHGSHDMRMLGPANSIAWTGEGCNFLMRCTCDWRTYSMTKNGDNVFSGWARYRGGSLGDLATWSAKGEDLPRFGNVDRVEMLTYRTIDKRQYMYSNDGGTTWLVDWELMPAFMAFTDVDFTKKGGNFWDYGGSDVGPSIVNPLGMYRAGNLDGYNIDEFINYTQKFRFEDVFESRTMLGDWISYPSNLFSSSKDGELVSQWYEFKTAENGDYIQWAWRDIWWPIERNTVDFNDIFNKALALDEFSATKGPFFGLGGDTLKGKLSFLNIEYPDYVYDWTNMELRKVIDEGAHTLKFIAPEKDAYTGEYLGGFKVQLDIGPVRCLDIYEGVWLCESSSSVSDEDSELCNIELYKECTNNPLFIPEEEEDQEDTKYDKNDFWASDVTLFGTGYQSNSKSAAEADNRKCTTYTTPEDGIGSKDIENNEYFQRGLNVTINKAAVTSDSIPINVIHFFSYDFEIEDVVCGTDDISIELDLFDINRSVGRVVATFKYGSEPYVPEPDPDAEEPDLDADEETHYKYFHIPQIIVSSLSVGGEKQELCRSGGVEIYTGEDDLVEQKVVVLNWSNSIEYLLKGETGLIIDLCSIPTEAVLDELSSKNMDRYIEANKDGVSFISPVSCELYEDIITSAVEDIKTYERKFFISSGKSENAAPHQNHALSVIQNHKSTVYQTDGSVVKIPGSDADDFNMTSKVRGRLLKKTYANKTPLSGELSTMEAEQERLYNEAIGTLPDSVTMAPIIMPGLFNALVDRNLEFFIEESFIITNSVVRPLARLNVFPPMSGEGHTWVDGNYHTQTCDGRGDCGFLTESVVFQYNYTPLDPNADLSMTVASFGGALSSYLLGGSAILSVRLGLKELYIANGFYNKYVDEKTPGTVWADGDSGLLFTSLSPKGSGALIPGTVSSQDPYDLFWDILNNRAGLNFHV